MMSMNKINTIYRSKFNATLSLGLSDDLIPENRFDLHTWQHLDIWIACINRLRRLGLSLNQDPYYTGHFKVLSRYHKYGNWKGLECKTEIYPTGIKFDFYQNVNTGDRKEGDGYYCFDKYNLMPYMIKKRFEYVCSFIIDIFKELLPDAVIDNRDNPPLAAEAILKHCQNNHWKNGNPTTLDDIASTVREYDIKYNSTDRDKKQILCGQLKYFRHHDGRLLERYCLPPYQQYVVGLCQQILLSQYCSL